MALDFNSVLQQLYAKFANKEAIKTAVPAGTNTNNVMDVLNVVAQQNGGGSDGFSRLLSLAGPLISTYAGGGAFNFNSILGMVSSLKDRAGSSGDITGAFDLDPADPDFDSKAKDLAAYHLAKAALLRRAGEDLIAKASKTEKVVAGLKNALEASETDMKVLK